MIATASAQGKGQFSGSYLPLINILNFICKRSAAMQPLVTGTVASCCLHSYCNSFLDNFVFYCCWLQPDQRQPRRCFGLDSLHGPAHDSRSKVGGHADPRVCRHCIVKACRTADISNSCEANGIHIYRAWIISKLGIRSDIPHICMSCETDRNMEILQLFTVASFPFLCNNFLYLDE